MANALIVNSDTIEVLDNNVSFAMESPIDSTPDIGINIINKFNINLGFKPIFKTNFIKIKPNDFFEDDILNLTFNTSVDGFVLQFIGFPIKSVIHSGEAAIVSTSHVYPGSNFINKDGDVFLNGDGVTQRFGNHYNFTNQYGNISLNGDGIAQKFEN